jgi:ribosomal protein L37E
MVTEVSVGFLVQLTLLTLLGVVIFWRGMRGRRVGDDHPFCRRCGFDLFGLPPGRDVCTECGADLKRRSWVSIPSAATAASAVGMFSLRLHLPE